MAHLCVGFYLALFAVLLPFAQSKAVVCNDMEMLFRTTFECMLDINAMVYSNDGCSKIPQAEAIIADCLTIPEKCHDETYKQYVAPKIDEIRLLVESFKIKCSSGAPNNGRVGRASCTYSEAANCVSTYDRIRNIPAITLLNVFTLCNTIDTYVREIQTCKDFTLACAGASDPNVQNALPTIEAFINYAEEMQSKGCNCARQVYNCSIGVLGSNICEDIRRASSCALTVADLCVKNLVFVFVQVDWLALTVEYLRANILFVPFACQVIAVGINLFSGSNIARVSTLLLVMALSIHWVIRKHRH